MKAEGRQIPQKIATRVKFVYCCTKQISENIILIDASKG